MLYAISPTRDRLDYMKFPDFWKDKYNSLTWKNDINELGLLNGFLFISNENGDFLDVKFVNNLNESAIFERFLNLEVSEIPLAEIPFSEIKETIIDPTTGNPYKGMVLEGIFAVLKPELNNNKRLYSVPEYLELLKKLKKQIFSEKGVYGEYEHPQSYAVNSNNISHKILDVWYDPIQMIVYGRILLLNNEKGKLAQEIVRSGGKIAMSARAAGDEIKNNDGTFTAVTKLLTTYDIVYHPGFSDALLTFRCLNESEGFSKNTGFSTKIYEKDLGNLQKSYYKYISSNEKNIGFLNWYNLNESISKEEKFENKKDEKILEKNESPDKENLENNLKNSINEKDLYFQEVNVSQKNLRKNLGKSFYDNSAGFIKAQTTI